MLALIMRERHCDFAEALKFGCEFVGGNLVRPAPLRRVERQHDKGDDAARMKSALTIWKEAGSIGAPIAARYFGRRKLVLPAGIDGAALRFHPHCPFGPGVRHPAIVALYRDIKTNERRAISRTALTPEGVKIDRKMLGPIDGTACKLSPDEDVEHGLHVAEGIETAIAGMMLGFAPMWALGSSGASRLSRCSAESSVSRSCATMTRSTHAPAVDQARTLRSSVRIGGPRPAAR
jgi:hypothetical protein